MRPEEVHSKRTKRAYMGIHKRHELVNGPLAQMSEEELMALHAAAPLSAFAHAIRASLRARDPNNPHDAMTAFTPSGNYAIALRQAMRAEAGLPIDSTEEEQAS